jgi:hypothetical protein
MGTAIKKISVTARLKFLRDGVRVTNLFFRHAGAPVGYGMTGPSSSFGKAQPVAYLLG